MYKIFIAKEKIGKEHDVAAYSESEEFVKAYIFLNPKMKLSLSKLTFEEDNDFVMFSRDCRGLELKLLSVERDDIERCIVLTKQEFDELDNYKNNNCDELVDYDGSHLVLWQLKPEYIDLLKRVGYYYLSEISRLTGDMHDMYGPHADSSGIQCEMVYNSYRNNIEIDPIRLRYFVEAYNGSYEDFAGHSLNLDRRMGCV
jgi:hypothetical protein